MTRISIQTALVITAMSTSALAVGAVEVPAHLAEVLGGSAPCFVFRYNWPALAGAAVVRELSVARAEDLSTDVLIADVLYVPAIDARARLGLPDSTIREIWIARSSLDSGSGESVWVLTDLTSAETQTELERAGWSAHPVLEGVFGRAPTPQNDPDLEASLEGANLEEKLNLESIFMLVRPRVAVLGDGWLELISPGVSAERARTQAALVKLPDPESDDGPPFPYSELLGGAARTYLILAADLEDNSGDPGTAWRLDPSTITPGNDSPQQLRTRAKALRHHRYAAVLRQVGDVAVRMSGTDGGVALDAVARRPGGGGEEPTAHVLELAKLVLQISAMPSSPNLAREIGYGRIDARDGEVLAGLVLSESSLLEAVANDTDRQRELADLYRRLSEYDREQYRQQQSKPHTSPDDG